MEFYVPYDLTRYLEAESDLGLPREKLARS
jgi:hypothetical protein